MKKATFIYTPNQMMDRCYYTENIWKSYSKNAMLLPPLGITYLASVLLEKGFDVSLIDANILRMNREEIIERLNQLMPDYLLFTSVTDNFQDTLYWIKQIRQGYDRPVIIGGPHLDSYPKETLTYQCIDYAVIGDGWETLPELLNVLEAKGDLSSVKGICYKDCDEIILTEPRPSHVSLEDVPFPARHLLPNDRYDTVVSKARPITTMITALGCPFRCTYCSTHAKLRPRTAEHIIAEVEECIEKYGIREIEFYDDTFTVNKSKLFRFLDLIESKSLKFLWSIRTRVDCVTQEMINRMAKSGCVRINYGIESADERILKSIGRAMPLDMIRNATKWTKQAGITSCGFFMIGLPGDTRETIEKTLNFMLELDLDFVQVNKFVPTPNSKIHDDIKKKTGQDFWRDYTLGKATFDDYKAYDVHVTPEELDRYLDRAYRSFFFRPKQIWQKLINIRSFTELYRLSSAAVSLFR